MYKNYLIGISFKLINCFLFPVMSFLMLKISTTLPVMQIFFVQAFLGAVISLIYLLVIKQNIPLTMSKKDFLLYIGRALANFIGIYLWIFSLSELGINEATALGYIGPLLVILMAKYIIGEKLFNLKILSLLIANIFGMLVILQPKYLELSWQGVASALGAIFLWSIYEVICKKQTSNQHYMLQAFYFMAFSSVVMLPFALQDWQAIDSLQGSLLILVGLIAVTNITIIFIAFSFAPLTILAPFSYARLIFTGLLTNWLYSIESDKNLFIGAAIILLANIYFTYSLNKVIKPLPSQV